MSIQTVTPAATSTYLYPLVADGHLADTHLQLRPELKSSQDHRCCRGNHRSAPSHQPAGHGLVVAAAPCLWGSKFLLYSLKPQLSLKPLKPVLRFNKLNPDIWLKKVKRQWSLHTNAFPHFGTILWPGKNMPLVVSTCDSCLSANHLWSIYHIFNPVWTYCSSKVRVTYGSEDKVLVRKAATALLRFYWQKLENFTQSWSPLPTGFPV